MKRRRLVFIALAAAVVPALFVGAKIAARWRPVKIGAISGSPRNGIIYPDSAVRVGRHALLAGGGALNWDRFDLGAGTRRVVTRRVVTRESLVEGSDIAVQTRPRAPGVTQLLLRDGGSAPVAYAMRDPRPDESGGRVDFSETLSRNLEAALLSRRNLRVSPALNRVEVVWNGVYYRWNRATRALERRTVLKLRGIDGIGEKFWVLARDGETLIVPTTDGIARYSTRTGARTGRIRLPEFKGFQGTGGWPVPSDYGAYAFFSTHRYKTKNNLARLYDAKSGRLVCEFEVPDVNVVAAFAPDEKTIAIARLDLRIWELRACQTGAIIRTLPLLPGTAASAFSPDGGALYSVANGVLYRQRAR